MFPSQYSRTGRPVAAGVILGAVLAVAAPLAASAHIHVTPENALAEASTTLTFSFSHGCEDSPTTALVVDIPEGVTNVVPLADAGWGIEREMNGDGTVRQVSFTAVSPIENGIKAEVSLDARFGEALAATEVPIPVTQVCVAGSTAWTAITEDGEEEPESPAPIVAVGAVAEDDGHGTDGPEAEHWADADAATTETAPASDPTALWLGAGGILLGATSLGVALAALRRRRA